MRRTLLIAGSVLGLAIVAGLVAERPEAARTAPAEQQAKPAPVQPRTPEPRVDSTAAKPVSINAVTPWIEVARMPEYVQASSAERKAIRDLYWRVCVEAKVPLEQRSLAYSQFVLDWESTESQSSRDEQPGARSPVNAEKMGGRCKS